MFAAVRSLVSTIVLAGVLVAPAFAAAPIRPDPTGPQPPIAQQLLVLYLAVYTDVVGLIP